MPKNDKIQVLWYTTIEHSVSKYSFRFHALSNVAGW